MRNSRVSLVHLLALALLLASVASATRHAGRSHSAAGVRHVRVAPRIPLSSRHEPQLPRPQVTTVDVEVDGHRFVQTTTVTKTALGRLFETCLSPPGVDVEIEAASNAASRPCVIRLEPIDVGQVDASPSPTLSLSATSTAIDNSSFSATTAPLAASAKQGVVSFATNSGTPETLTVAVLTAAPSASVSLLLAPPTNGSTALSNESFQTSPPASTTATKPGLVLPSANTSSLPPFTASSGEGGLLGNAASTQLSSLPFPASTDLGVTPPSSTNTRSTSPLIITATTAFSLTSLAGSSTTSDLTSPSSTPDPSGPQPSPDTASSAAATAATAATTGSSALGPTGSRSADLASGRIDTSSSTVSTAAASASAAMPGTQLQVLPVGLGVFAGVSVVALAIVGLVTYERRKYRKLFRSRRDAEQAGLQDVAEAASPPGFIPMR